MASCAQYAKAYRSNPKIDDVFLSWTLGYISAINAVGPGFFDLGVITADEMARRRSLWMEF